MKNIFSRSKKEMPAQDKAVSFIPATRVMRDEIIAFIIQSLKPYIDEKGLAIAGLDFYIVCSNHQQEEAARVALYADKPGMFKTDHLERTLVNHFIELTPGWFFEGHIIKDQLPENCMQKGNYGVRVTGAGEPVSKHYEKARIEILAGQAEHKEYILDPGRQLKFYIGRSRLPQLPSGKIQQNDIVFLSKGEAGFDELTGSPNLRVSRNHAFIVYEPATGRYLLYPDKGGLPDNGNKLKVHTTNESVKWLNIYGVAHWLRDGDQVELGGEAILRFRLPAS